MDRVRKILNYKRPVAWFVTLAVLVVLFLGIGLIAKVINEANLESLDYIVDDRGNYGSKIKWGDTEYAAYGFPPTYGFNLFRFYDLGRQIGVMKGHDEDEVYEVKRQDPHDWLIVYPRTVIMSVAILYKAENVTEIPPEFESAKFEKEVHLEVSTTPDQYTPFMSSTPGIRLDITYDGPPAGHILYEAKTGGFLTWEKSVISELGNRVQRPMESPSLYWRPNRESPEEDLITVSAVDEKGELITSSVVQIRKDDNGFFTALSIVDQY